MRQAQALQAIQNIDSGTHRIDATPAIPQQENETNAISKIAMQVGAQPAGGPDDGNASPSSVPNLSAISDHFAPGHLEGNSERN